MKKSPADLTELDELASRPDEAVIAQFRDFEGDILIAGAGGKMGFHLARMLRRILDTLGKPNGVIAVSRFGDSSSREPFHSIGVETISCDLTDEGGAKSLPDAAAVFFLAGRKFGTGDSPETLHLFNEIMPARVADRFGDSRIVALSTGCVYPFVKPGTGGSREIDPVAPVGAYANSCLGRELAFQAASEKHQSPLALIRLNYSVDLRYGVLVDIAHKIYTDQPVDVSMGYLNCIWQGDATRHIISALSLATPAPDAFVLNITGREILKVRDLAIWFGKRFDKAVAFTGTETDTAWLNDASKSHQLFGNPTVSESDLMEWVAAWIENDNPLLGKPTHFEVRDGNY